MLRFCFCSGVVSKQNPWFFKSLIEYIRRTMPYCWENNTVLLMTKQIKKYICTNSCYLIVFRFNHLNQNEPMKNSILLSVFAFLFISCNTETPEIYSDK